MNPNIELPIGTQFSVWVLVIRHSSFRVQPVALFR
jgi:hypothetical protein